MNIHINKEDYNNIIIANHVKLPIGSVVYGLNDEHSDEDYLLIYQPFVHQINNPFMNHHQFQYKENNVDYNLVDYIIFIKNLVSGDSTINFELLWADEFNNENNQINWLSEYKKDFITYNIINAYIGFAKRDIKYFNKRLTDIDKKRGLVHINRSVTFASELLYDNNLTLKNEKLLEYKKDITNLIIKDDIYNSDLFINYKNILESLKKELNLRLENKTINRYLNPEKQESIVYKLNYLNTIRKTCSVIDLSKIYLTNENGQINY
jgi:hypothetical protein